MTMAETGARMSELSSTEAAAVSTAQDAFAHFQSVADQDAPPDRICAQLAKLFHVKADEVALLRLERSMLHFLFPPGLKTAGSIPLTGPAVAARTAATKSTLLSNNFPKIKHVRIFEEVKPGLPQTDAPERLPIQKLMSVPILGQARQVLGVIQISRKGFDPGSAGADFTSDDLKVLERAAAVIAEMKFMH